MDSVGYNAELRKLERLKEGLINKAKEERYHFIDGKFIKEESIYAIHITISTLGEGEYLGEFELFDKLLYIDEDFALKTKEVSTLEDFVKNILCYTKWDDDYLRTMAFETVDLSDWFYANTNTEKSYKCKDVEQISQFRFSYLGSTMGDVTIIKCPFGIFKGHKNIYHTTKRYV